MSPVDIADLCGLKRETQALCALYFREQMPARALTDWFSAVDFEALAPEVTCMAAVAGAMCQFSGVPQEQIPRLRGIIRYVHTLNSGMMSGVCLIGEALNRAGIDVLLLEDTALYLSYPDVPQRHLWQTRIGVRRRDFHRAVETVREAGFAVEAYAYAAAARQGITRQASIVSVEDGSYLWRGVRELKRGSVRFLCPEIAASFILINQSAFRALTKAKPGTAVVRWIMDMKQLLTQMRQEDWHRATQIAREEKAGAHIRLLLELYCALSGQDALSGQMEAFGDARSAHRIPGLIKRFQLPPEKSSRLRRAYLLCRLRRPDSVWQSLVLLGKRGPKKLTHP